jgi:hypothetical protein
MNHNSIASPPPSHPSVYHFSHHSHESNAPSSPSTSLPFSDDPHSDRPVSIEHKNLIHFVNINSIASKKTELTAAVVQFPATAVVAMAEAKVTAAGAPKLYGFTPSVFEHTSSRSSGILQYCAVPYRVVENLKVNVEGSMAMPLSLGV